MKHFKICKNKYLNQDINGYYNQDYVGYQKKGNPDFINHLKNMSCSKDEMDLVEDFIAVCDCFGKDLKEIVKLEQLSDFVVLIVPRSKAEKNYKQCQLMFKKAISSTVNKLGINNGIDAIKRIKDTKTTHDWRLEHNTGEAPYVGITKDTCEINTDFIKNKNIILVDDIYTENVNTIEDCIQTLLDMGAKRVIMYAVARTTKS